jgi:hypothetical protein
MFQLYYRKYVCMAIKTLALSCQMLKLSESSDNFYQLLIVYLIF